MSNICRSIGCINRAEAHQDFCEPCNSKELPGFEPGDLSEKYPQQYKSVGDMESIDVFAVHHLFQLQDPSGCLQHASRLLLSNPDARAVREARDTLTRWLQLNQEHPHANQRNVP